MAEETHGFTTREAWHRFFEEYSRSIDELNQSGNELSQSESEFSEWVERYRENSRQLRRAYLRNEELLGRHLYCYIRGEKPWTRAVADPLLACLFREITRLEDTELAYDVVHSLIGFYTGLNDEIALMKCDTVSLVCLVFLDHVHLSDQIWHLYLNARRCYEARFDELDPEEQSMGLTLYDVAFEVLCVYLLLKAPDRPPLASMLLECYRSASKWEKRVLDADRGYEFNRCLPPFDAYFASSALNLSPGECPAEQAERILQVAERAYQRTMLDPNASGSNRANARLLLLMAQRLTGRDRDRQLLEQIEGIVTVLSMGSGRAGDRFERDDSDLVDNVYRAAEELHAAGLMGRALYERVLRQYLRYFARLPISSYQNYVASNQTFTFVYHSLRHLDNQREVLLRLTVFRQVQTAMHSIMVAKLAVAVTESLIDAAPGLLAGLLSAETAEEVRARRDVFLEFIYTGALLYDVGKILCANVINTQYRRLNEIELRAIRFHPSAGGEMLRSLPQLARFADIALGHHKAYDGKGGYPRSFDNTASPWKPLIDIITVCDSLDAATDHLGRNYTKAKTFDEVLEEMRAGRNTRYSGVLVELLDGDAALRDRVRRLLDEGRGETYYQTHQLLREPSGSLNLHFKEKREEGNVIPLSEQSL